MKTVLITGATSGIGLACAHVFVKHHYQIIITGRRQERLQDLAKTLQTNFDTKVLSLCFDVRESDAVFNTIKELPADWQNIDILINNAGLALGRGTIDEGDLSDWDTMIDTNVKGLLYVSKAMIPLLKNTQHAHIINIGSIAGKETYHSGNVYCATKHAVDALTKAMRIDLLPHGIKVTGICPGAVETEFSLVRFHGNHEKAKKVYDGFTPLTPNDVAEVVFFAASQPAHVNLNDIVITPTAQANTVHIQKNA